MPKSLCPSGKPCLYYSAAIDAGPDMDGCVGPCRRSPERRVTFAVETYINGIRFDAGDYTIARVGPASKPTF